MVRFVTGVYCIVSWYSVSPGRVVPFMVRLVTGVYCIVSCMLNHMCVMYRILLWYVWSPGCIVPCHGTLCHLYMLCHNLLWYAWSPGCIVPCHGTLCHLYMLCHNLLWYAWSPGVLYSIMVGQVTCACWSITYYGTPSYWDVLYSIMVQPVTCACCTVTYYGTLGHQGVLYSITCACIMVRLVTGEYCTVSPVHVSWYAWSPGSIVQYYLCMYYGTLGHRGVLYSINCACIMICLVTGEYCTVLRVHVLWYAWSPGCIVHYYLCMYYGTLGHRVYCTILPVHVLWVLWYAWSPVSIVQYRLCIYYGMLGHRGVLYRITCACIMVRLVTGV